MNDITIRLFFFSRDDKNYITSNPTLYSCAQTYVTVLYRTPMIDSMYKKKSSVRPPEKSDTLEHRCALQITTWGRRGETNYDYMSNQEKIYIYIDIEGLCGCPGGDGGGRGGGRRFFGWVGMFLYRERSVWRWDGLGEEGEDR